MNSIMQEASSLAKAVEQAWIKAGKPQRFSIRVFEDAEKNFLGISTKPAKIALLFEKEDIAHKTEHPERRKEARPQSYTQQPQQQRAAQQPQQQKRQEQPRKPQPLAQPAQQPQQQRPTQQPQQPKPVAAQPVTPAQPVTQQPGELPGEESKPKIFWTNEMVDIANGWLKDMLEKMDKKDITFTTEIKRYHLKLSINKNLMEDSEKQKNLFRNYAFLIMQTVRNRLKKQFKFHKIVLTCEQ